MKTLVCIIIAIGSFIGIVPDAHKKTYREQHTTRFSRTLHERAECMANNFPLWSEALRSSLVNAPRHADDGATEFVAFPCSTYLASVSQNQPRLCFALPPRAETNSEINNVGKQALGGLPSSWHRWLLERLVDFHLGVLRHDFLSWYSAETCNGKHWGAPNLLQNGIVPLLVQPSPLKQSKFRSCEQSLSVWRCKISRPWNPATSGRGAMVPASVVEAKEAFEYRLVRNTMLRPRSKEPTSKITSEPWTFMKCFCTRILEVILWKNSALHNRVFA